MLIALLEPGEIKKTEDRMDYTARFALMEDIMQLPWGAVWDKFCMVEGVPISFEWIDEVNKYDAEV